MENKIKEREDMIHRSANFSLSLASWMDRTIKMSKNKLMMRATI